MPFADQSGCVAGPPEELRHENGTRRKIPPRVARVRANHAGYADQFLVTSRQQRRPRRRTNRAVGIEPIESHPLPDEPINVRRAEIGGAIGITKGNLRVHGPTGVYDLSEVASIQFGAAEDPPPDKLPMGFSAERAPDEHQQ